jgi:hypothetical protein
MKFRRRLHEQEIVRLVCSSGLARAVFACAHPSYDSILTSILLPALSFLKAADALNLFYSGLGIGSLGIVLLFFARLPLYHQRRFWTFGPRELPAFHRKLYWLAYLFVVASVLLLAVVWLKVK